MDRVVSASSRLVWRGVKVPPRELRDVCEDHKHVHNLLTRLARNLALGDEKPTQQDWDKLLKDLLELQSTLFTCVTKEECNEMYASSLLTSGDAASIKLASDVLTCSSEGRPRNSQLVNYARSVEIVSNAAKEYFNSASTLTDPALELAKCCLTLIKDGNQEIQLELDLIHALQILAAFGLSVLPIQGLIAKSLDQHLKKLVGQLDQGPDVEGGASGTGTLRSLCLWSPNHRCLVPKERLLRWYGHVLRRPEDHMVRVALNLPTTTQRR